jgi:hypothetical protein
MACLHKTAVMNPTSTAAAEALQGLLPIHHSVGDLVVMRRLNCSGPQKLFVQGYGKGKVVPVP